MWTIALALLLQSAEPRVPELDLASFPPAARETISRVYREAAAHPESVERLAAYGRILHAWEQWEAAHTAYERLQRLDSKAFEWHYLDAVVLQRLAHHAEAEAHLRQALAVDPQYLPARIRLAEVLLEIGRLEDSRKLFEALAGEPAAEPVAQLGLGRIAAAQGDHARAVTHLERAVELFPELGAAHYALARSYRTLGRAEDAQRAVVRHRQYGARWPAIDDAVLSRVTALKDDARALLQRGMKLADQGDLRGAIAAHEAALAAEPGLADAHSNLISLYARAAEYGKAEVHYRAVVALGVNLSEAHYDYAVSLGMQEKWDRAADSYRLAIAANPLHAQARNNLGQILERERRFTEAADQYREAVQAQPTFRLARFNLGRMMIALGRTGDAIGELERLTEPRDEEAPRYLFALSVAYVRAGRTDEGRKWGHEALDLARRHRQHELAAAIERDLARLQ